MIEMEELEVPRNKEATSVEISTPGGDSVKFDSIEDFQRTTKRVVEDLRSSKSDKDPGYVLIDERDMEHDAINDMIERCVKEVHDALRGADIQPAWMIGKKPDKDGRLVLGRMKRCTELDRLLHDHDAILLLNREAWQHMSEPQREALIDHELCHLDVAIDEKSGEPKYDAHGRKVYRTRKHDLEEFRGVIERHGCYKRDIIEFVRAALDRDPNLDLFEDEAAKASR